MADIRVGTASWTDKTLIESGWYPPEANNPEKRLRYYTRQFPLVEVDSTYYALPAEQTAAAWAHRSPKGFVFNIKAYSLFTHHPTRIAALPKDLRPVAEKTAKGKASVYLKDVDPELADQAWERFLSALEPLRQTGRLGAILFQFPQWFVIGRERKDYILSCAERVAPRQLCIEFRNKTWLSEDNREETHNSGTIPVSRTIRTSLMSAGLITDSVTRSARPSPTRSLDRRGDERPAARPDPDLDQPAGFEHPERLTHGDPADPEPLAQIAFGWQPVPGLELPLPHQQADLLDDDLRDPATLTRLNMSGSAGEGMAGSLAWTVSRDPAIGHPPSHRAGTRSGLGAHAPPELSPARPDRSLYVHLRSDALWSAAASPAADLKFLLTLRGLRKPRIRGYREASRPGYASSRYLRNVPGCR